MWNFGYTSILFIWLPILGIEDESGKLYGVQFHPEVDLTENGITIMKNFLYGVSNVIH